MLGPVASIAPIFGLILLGIVAGRFNWLSPGADKGLADFTFVLAIPVLLFRTMVTADMGEADPLRLLGAYFAAVAIIWGLATAIAGAGLKLTAPEGAVFAMTSSYGNIVLLGIPIAYGAFGPAATPTAAVIVTCHVVVLWVAACLHLALVSADARPGAGEFFRTVLGQFLRNPIVVAIVLGVIWRITGLGIQGMLDRAVTMLGQAGVPCALVAVGLSLAKFRVKGELRPLLAALALKNVAMPAVAWMTTTKLFGLPALPAIVITLFAAMPTGTATFLFATRNQLPTDAPSASVALSTGSSMLTVPILLMLIAA